VIFSRCFAASPSSPSCVLSAIGPPCLCLGTCRLRGLASLLRRHGLILCNQTLKALTTASLIQRGLLAQK
jgi:hypothetical protein